MKKILLMVLALFVSQAQAKEYLVKYKNQTLVQNLQRITMNEMSPMVMLDHNSKAKLIKVSVNGKKEAQVLAELLGNSEVEYVVPNFKLRAFSAPIEVEALKEQWAISKVQAEKAWTRAGNKGSKKIVVAVIDTGVDYKHKSLASNMMAGYDFKDKDNDPMDKTSQQNPGHGTHCAGIVGANGLVDGGIVGMSPDVTIMPIRFLGADGSGDLNDAIKAIDFAIEKGAHVISASWGASVPRSQATALLEAIKRADDKGLIFIAAAANDGKNNDVTEVYPANNGLPNSITVAASGSSDAKPSWSNYGMATVHVSSPGENIMSTLPADKYGNLSGTSMATPLVSGMVAFLKSQDPTLTGAQIRAILQTTGAKVSIQTACNCRVDAFNAVDAILNKQMTVVPAAGTIKPAETLNFSAVYAKEPLKFSVSDTKLARIDEKGLFTSLAEGAVKVTVTDADGKTANSLDINIKTKSGGGGGGGNPPWPSPGEPGEPGQPGEPGECPIGDPALCQIICAIQPDLPFCQSK